MSVATANPVLLTDGDIAFLRVDNRRPPHALEPGVAASATNKRSEQGKMGPRFGCALDHWGIAGINIVSTTWSGPNLEFFMRSATVTGFEVGKTYQFVPTLGEELVATLSFIDDALLSVKGTFVATQTVYYLRIVLNLVATGAAVTTAIRRLGTTCAYKRFSDLTTDTDQGILLTDDWRDAAGEDGGRGRAWRILPGNGPQEISLHGHDVWGTARLIQCYHALALLRHGNERHYFNAAAVGNNVITLNVAPSWSAGDRVLFAAATDDATLTTAPIAITDTDLAADTLTAATTKLTTGVAVTVSGITGATTGYVRVVSPGLISLYDTQAHAIAGGATGKFNVTVDDETGSLLKTPPNIGTRYYAGPPTTTLTLFTDEALTNQLGWDAASATGKFYVELDRYPKPFFGDGAPVLLMQPGPNTTAFDNGFVAAPTEVQVLSVTGTPATDLNAANHRLAPGDAVSLTLGTMVVGTAPPYWVYPTSEHTLTLHDDATEALTGLNPLTIGTPGTASIKKTSAAGLPIPPGREGVYLAGRLWLVNGDDELVYSDPFDFLHFTRFVSQVPANQGEAGRVNWLCPLGEDVMAIGKDQKVIGLSGISGPVTGWREGTITAQYGGLASLAALNVGTDVQFASRKGWASIIRTVAGERLGITRSISDSIPQYLQAIDWGNAQLMCAETWNGRLFWGVPIKEGGTKVLVLNYNNTQLFVQQAVVDGDIAGGVRVSDEGVPGPDAWEGSWEGDLLEPYAFAKLTIGGEERLSWATTDGRVCWFHDGWDDDGEPIADELVTRGYFGGREVLALKGLLKWETWQPKLSAYIRSAGYNEESALVGFVSQQYDRTMYLVAGVADYDPATSTPTTFDVPHRADYSPAPEELLAARLDVHQAISEPFRCRVRDHTIQLRIVNEQGSARICGVSLQAKAVGIAATRKT